MADKSPAITLLRLLGKLLPGDWLKTAFYLNVIAKPRRMIRLAINGFYRMEHVYDVLAEFKGTREGPFSVLEFGTNEGYSLAKILYATKYLGMSHQTTVHGFDTFEGMPASSDRRDMSVVANKKIFLEGQFRGGYERLDAFLGTRYANYELHKGLFGETLSDEFLASLADRPPILVWIDCDFYSSTRSVFERLLPALPSGCVVYFDEIELDFGSRLAGEARAVYEVNAGEFGDGIELVLDPRLSLDSRRVYRFVRFEGGPHYRRLRPSEPDPGRPPSNGSVLP